MSKYEVPKCECGKELKFVKQVVFDCTYKINKNGELSKKRTMKEWSEEGNTQWLECEDCNNRYEVETDDDLKFIRGEIIL